MSAKRPRLALDAYERGVRDGDRAILAQAITLIESRDDDDSALAQALLTRLLPSTGAARRVGVTGVPGVGKSTFVDELGMRLVARGPPRRCPRHRSVEQPDGWFHPRRQDADGEVVRRAARVHSPFAERAVARWHRATHPRNDAPLLRGRPASSVVLDVETVGVGQGETAVADMVDFFLVLALPGSGDELQGIKKGVLELADAIAVNKADGDGATRARIALGDIRAALRYFATQAPRGGHCARSRSPDRWATASTRLWGVIEEHRASLEASGELKNLRAEQQRAWMWSLILDRLERTFRTDPRVATRLASVEADVIAGRTTPTLAADELLAAWGVAKTRDA